MKHLNLNWKEEEFWNALSHGIGAVMGIFGLYLLLIEDDYKSEYSTLSILFYGVSILILYLASTVYHLIAHVSWKQIFRKIDHISIYFLIAGTYTPVALISLADGNGWIIFWTVWGIAAVGTILKLFFTGRFEALSLILYLAMGWLIVLDWDNLVAVSTEQGIQLLMLGGAFYTLGIVFYVIRKIPFNHFIWHLFVLGGSICHFLFILTDVI
ncbi:MULTISPECIES: hemolysin III family protein [unclassified Leeuwenhoekiella]|uniref:PAQR family membrane homeostasis protein TrhA n=1 Tax=unclassified Leeuwenhoekiella TaxID=2615029 RepID=UPI000C63AD2B|nr:MULTISPECIES: hemolysin III family protein [unclassified Leeuwenhoekiella]MAW94777.1 hemolysin III family protein [Leeuwenhoekiella sp.]MBA79496.1 hemolysin III family protein [Leeuwenhoekiella sp.]|tara:strand:- start:2338 stop:2973 length:636 start_codon:yes stop_codon:yes gene_type:complete